MKHILFIFFILTFISCAEVKQPIEKVINDQTGPFRDLIEFVSKDGLKISADIYKIDNTSPIIILCHQARYNKSEYMEIAPKLNAMGFNCIAINQRSGGDLNGFKNDTYERAKEKNLSTDYLDAEQDITAAIEFIKENKSSNQKIILWGSSYSSTLAMYFIANNSDIDAVVAFSPGNYFSEQKGSLIPLLKDVVKPVFVTSSKSEAPSIKELLVEMRLNNNQIHFIPASKGYHGSKALWKWQKGGKEYWGAITSFLEQFKK
ncbi:MAG TPA: hypothetical protein EYG86_09965 [Crocinitomicaceae bacterium]|nr:hypothetical protein [Crocinitomicaceae bacterium]